MARDEGMLWRLQYSVEDETIVARDILRLAQIRCQQ